ncbi:MAG: TetR/AcrR family transcriptional regulator [Actinobacteria bacterium]|nr:TetR/AcrR family transcriptional regulator [Actinomycetota bacterium]
MPTISAPTLEAHRAVTIDRLLQAWGELVMERGYEDVSLADVAAKAGLARTAIYNYFPDREALLFAWTDREVRRVLDRIAEQLAEVESPAEKLELFVRMELESFVTSHLPPEQGVVHFLGPETYARFMDHLEPVEAVLLDIIEEGIASGDFAPGDAAATVPLVMASIGSERGPLATGEHDLDEAAERVIGFVLRALTPSGRKRKRR